MPVLIRCRPRRHRAGGTYVNLAMTEAVTDGNLVTRAGLARAFPRGSPNSSPSSAPALLFDLAADSLLRERDCVMANINTKRASIGSSPEAAMYRV